MDFFGLGFGEILLIIVIALILFGPGRIPEVARTLGKTVRAFRKAAFDLTTAITKEVETEEKDHLSQPKAASSDGTKKSPDAGMPKSSDTEVASPRDR